MNWFLAIRPKTLTASIIPVMVGASLVSNPNWYLILHALFFALCIQIATNLFNDALDFEKGADTSSRKGPVRVTQSGLLSVYQVKGVGIAFLIAAALFSLPLVLHSGWPMSLLVVCSLGCTYGYTGGPYPIAYQGLGDLFVMLFFGWISVAAVVFLHTGMITMDALIAGTQVGCLATSLIAVNNLRDVEEDRVANKRTLAVRFGVLFSRLEISFLVVLPFILQLHWMGLGYWWLPMLTVPFATKIITGIWMYEPSKVYNEILVKTAALHLLFGGLLAFSLGQQTV